MGKDYPYYALWRLLEPEVLTTPEAFDQFPVEQRLRYFIRRTKEEMVRLDGKPLYPKRISDTLGYALSQGEAGEQRLYDETTEYLRYVYNRAKLLNQSAARLAMGVFSGVWPVPPMRCCVPSNGESTSWTGSSMMSGRET